MELQSAAAAGTERADQGVSAGSCNENIPFRVIVLHSLPVFLSLVWPGTWAKGLFLSAVSSWAMFSSCTQLTWPQRLCSAWFSPGYSGGGTLFKDRAETMERIALLFSQA